MYWLFDIPLFLTIFIHFCIFSTVLLHWLPIFCLWPTNLILQKKDVHSPFILDLFFSSLHHKCCGGSWLSMVLIVSVVTLSQVLLVFYLLSNWGTFYTPAGHVVFTDSQGRVSIHHLMKYDFVIVECSPYLINFESLSTGEWLHFYKISSRYVYIYAFFHSSPFSYHTVIPKQSPLFSQLVPLKRFKNSLDLVYRWSY